MSTENTWKDYYKRHQGIYSSGHFSDRTDLDGKIANEYHIRYREEILAHGGQDRTAVELGCGNKPIFDVLSAFSSVFYTDISNEALRAAKAEFESIIALNPTGSRVIFKEMNVEKFDFPDTSLDVVFNTRAPHRDETSRELYRTLKSGGTYIYQTVGEQDFRDFKILFKKGRFYEDYLLKDATRFQTLKTSLVVAGFVPDKVALIFDKTFKSFFTSKQELKDQLWLLVGEYDFDSTESNAVIDAYIEGHLDPDGKIFVENHRIILKAEK